MGDSLLAFMLVILIAVTSLNGSPMIVHHQFDNQRTYLGFATWLLV